MIRTGLRLFYRDLGRDDLGRVLLGPEWSPAGTHSSSAAQTALPHLVDAPPDLLLQREIPGPLRRRHEGGKIALFLLGEVDPGALRLEHAVDGVRDPRLISLLASLQFGAQHDARVALFGDELPARPYVLRVDVAQTAHLIVGQLEAVLHHGCDPLANALLQLPALALKRAVGRLLRGECWRAAE